MGSTNFQQLYREAYAQLGFELDSNAGVSDATLEKAEKKLEAKLPDALRDYYVVAGKETLLNRAFNRLLPINDLELHHGKLPFIEENQWVVIWGVDLKGTSDPPVFQGPVVKGEARNWFPECDHCSEFLIFMLHLQAAYGGGMPITASGPAATQTRSALDKDWNVSR